jgi:hypothetical protein
VPDSELHELPGTCLNSTAIGIEHAGFSDHHEAVARVRTQTHDDWTRADMEVYRSRLRSLGPCPS